MVSLWMLEDAIEKVKSTRRKRPWLYLACRSRLSMLQAERELVLEVLQSCDTRLANHRVNGVYHLKRYAVLSCRQLCGMVLTRLPRELRDLIYECLLPRTTVDARPQREPTYEWWCYSERVKMNTCDYYWQLLHGTHVLPSHCLDTGYMGNNMLSELALAWDRLTKFKIDVHQVPRLIRSDNWM
jgi:hypothetical protein